MNMVHKQLWNSLIKVPEQTIFVMPDTHSYEAALRPHTHTHTHFDLYATQDYTGRVDMVSPAQFQHPIHYQLQYGSAIPS